MILLHGPWPVRQAPDPSNRLSGNAAAIAFGRRLFFSPHLSRDRNQSCVTCHQPKRAFADGLARSTGNLRVDRNTIALANLRLNRWFGWGGENDNLWGQTIRPILDRRELAMTPGALKARVASHKPFAEDYRRVFGSPAASHDEELVLVNIAKAMAAFQETLTTGPTPFDRFRDALAAGDKRGSGVYPEAAKRGLRLFVGRGQCAVCHFGPNFTNGEFHNIGVIHFVGDKGAERRKVDPGRYGGIREVRKSRFSLLGPYNDDPRRSTAGFTRRVRLHPRNWGEFRVPSLRGVAQTAPYMHNGSLKTLEAVIRHYSEIPEERLHQGRARLLRPLKLTKRDIADLVAFLRTLSPRRSAGPETPD